MRLTDAAIRAIEPGPKRRLVTDGGGLGLEIFPSGAKAWRFRYQRHGRTEKISLGQYPTVSLKAARLLRDKLAVQVSEGRSPARDKQATKRAVGEHSTVRDFGARFLREIVSKVRRDCTQVRQALERDVYPVIGDRRIREVDAEDCRRVIRRKPQAGFDAAAGTLRGLLKQLLDYAV